MDNRIEIELLKKDVTTMSSLLEKFDTTIDKMQEIASSLSRMVSLQEQRLEAQEDATRNMQSILEMRRIEHNENIKDIYNRINTVNKELTEKIEDTEQAILKELQAIRAKLDTDKVSIGQKIGQIDAWKYTVIGAIILGAFLLGNLSDIAKFFH